MPAQPSARKPTEEVASTPSEFDKLKEQYAEDRQKAIEAVLRAFDKRLAEVQSAREWSKEDRAKGVRMLTAARHAFQETQELTPIFAMNDAWSQLTQAVRAARAPLVKKIEAAIKRLPKGDVEGLARLTKELNALDADLIRFDFLQAGRSWEGYRQDDAKPARFEYDPLATRWSRFKVVQDPGVQEELSFTVKARKGDQLTGEMAMGKRSIVMDVAGSFDGLRLEMKTTGVSKGAPRYFEYAGELRGNVGFLSLQGIKADGTSTSGKLMIQVR